MLRKSIALLCVGKIEHLASSTVKMEKERWKINIYVLHVNTCHVLHSSEDSLWDSPPSLQIQSCFLI